jgi:type IX secretion system PorP/SprF family membrane protein
MNIKKIRIIVICLLLIVFTSNAQQDEQSSLYMFNPLQFNPAFAGSRGYLNASAVIRNQWVGISGAPKSQFVSVNSPLFIKNMAAGLHISNDVIGAKERTSVYGDYAYTLNFENDYKLNLGVSLGAQQLVIDYNKLLALDPTESTVLSSISQFNFNSGVGAYYYSDKFYVGFSIPRFFQTKLENNSVTLSNSYTKRHYFLAAGYVYPINSVIDLKTSVLIKAVANAPIIADINANLFFYKKIWAGIMYRLNESVGLNVAYQIRESIMFGYSFDYPTSDLITVRNGGSHEVMLTYSINNHKKSYGSPRYF